MRLSIGSYFVKLAKETTFLISMIWTKKVKDFVKENKTEIFNFTIIEALQKRKKLSNMHLVKKPKSTLVLDFLVSIVEEISDPVRHTLILKIKVG